MCKCVYYISVYTSAIYEIGIYSAHIVVSFRHFKRFWLFFNYRCGLYWRAAVTAEQICYCFGIRLIVKPTDKVNGERLYRNGKESYWLDGTSKVSIKGNLWYHQYEAVGGNMILYRYDITFRRFF